MAARASNIYESSSTGKINVRPTGAPAAVVGKNLKDHVNIPVTLQEKSTDGRADRGIPVYLLG